MGVVERVFGWFAEISNRWPKTVILVIVLLTALSIGGITRIHQEYGQELMLPRGSETTKAMEEADKLFGGTVEEQVLVEAKNVVSAEMLRKVAGYRDFLEGKGDIWGAFATRVNTPLDDMLYFSDLPAGPGETYDLTPGGRTSLPGLAVARDPLLANINSLTDQDLERQVELNIQLREWQAEQAGFTLNPLNISPGRDALLIYVGVNPSLDGSSMIDLVRPFTTYTEEYFKEVPGTSVYISGEPTLSRDASRSTLSDTRLLFILALVFIVIVLFITFRRISDVLLTLLVILVTIVWVMGLSGWLRFPFSYASTAIMPLMLGIDIAYAIHVVSRYYEERGKGKGPRESMTTSVVTVGVAVFLTAATTAFGFASFSISNMPLIQQFGALCVVGVLSSFTLAVTLLPAAMVLRDRGERAHKRWEGKREKRESRWSEMLVDRVLVKVAVLSEHHRRFVALFTVLIIAACVLLGLHVSTEADVLKMLPQDLPYIVAVNKTYEHFGGQDFAFTLVKGDILEPENLKAILDYEDSLAAGGRIGERGDPIFQREKIVSIADLVLLANNHAIPSSKGEAIMALLRLQEQYASRSSTEGQSPSENRLITPDGQVALVSIRLARGSQEDLKWTAETIRERSGEISRAHPGISMTSGGMPLLLDETLGSIVPIQLKTTTLALILCALIVIIIFRSVFFGLAAASVVFTSIAMEIGVLVLLGWPLDFMTVMVSSLVIGAGIDFGIHITHRFREEWGNNGVEIDEAIRRTVRSVGKALLAAAVTTAGAFGIIAASKVSYMQRFGGITAFSLIFALLSSLLVLPSILAWRAMKVKKRI
jgi:hypothetical protein